MHHENAVSGDFDAVARHCNNRRRRRGPTVDFHGDFRRVVFQAGVNGICGEHVTAAAVDAYHDFRHSAQRVQFLRELPRGHFIAPPCFRSDVAVKNEFRGIVPACWLEVPKVFILRFCLRRCRFLHFLLPPLTFFLRASTAWRFGRSLNRSFP